MKHANKRNQFFSCLIEQAAAICGTATVRSWGSYVILHSAEHEGVTVYREKLMQIHNNVQLSLHKHLRYDEVWIADDDFEYVLENDKGKLIQLHAIAHERIFIPRGRKHLITSSARKLYVFEMQLGSISDDDNIKFTVPADIAANLLGHI